MVWGRKMLVLDLEGLEGGLLALCEVCWKPRTRKKVDLMQSFVELVSFGAVVVGRALRGASDGGWCLGLLIGW